MLLGTSGGVSHHHQLLLSALLMRLFTLTQVFTFMVSQMEDQVLQCFNDIPVDRNEANALIERAMQCKGDD